MAQAQAKHRITKQHLKEDPFSNFIFSTREWVEDNLRLVLMVVGGIVVVVLAVWAFNGYTTGREDSAAKLFGEAGVSLRSNDLPGAILGLQGVVDDYPSSDVAGLACFQLADAYFRQRRFDDAKVYYQRYLDDYGKDPMLVASAWGGLAAIDEHAQDFSAAVEKNFKAADIDPESFMRAEYLRQVIRCAIEANDTTSALRALKSIEDSHTDERNVKMARQRLIEYGYLKPTE